MRSDVTARRSAAIVLAIVVPAPSIGALVSFWIAPGAIGLTIYALCKAILYATPALWHRFVDRQPWSMSCPANTRQKHAWLLGIGSGLVVGAAILAAWWLLGDRAIDAATFRGLLTKNGLATPERFIAAAIWLSVVNSLLEEYVFRWFITTRIEALTSRGAAVLSAAAFTAHHVIVLLAYLPVGTAILASAGIFVGGLFWSWLYRRTRSVWPSWVSHMLVDLAVMAIGWQLLFGN